MVGNRGSLRLSLGRNTGGIATVADKVGQSERKEKVRDADRWKERAIPTKPRPLTAGIAFYICGGESGAFAIAHRYWS